MGERPYHLLGNHHGARQLHSAPPIFDRKNPGNEVDGGTRFDAVIKLSIWESREKSHESSTRKEARVRSLAAPLSHKWRVCQQATVVFDPPISGQRGFCLQK